MLRSRFLWKLWAGYAVLVLLTAVTVGSLVGREVELQTLAATDRRLRSEALLLAEVATAHLAGGTPSGLLDRRVETLGAGLGTRLTVVAPDGRVVADSERVAGSLDDHGDRPEVVEARRGGVGTATRWSDTMGERMRYLAVPLEGGYVARTALSLDVVADRRRELRNLVAAGAGLVTLAALVVAWVLARRVTRPLRVMTGAAAAIAGGDYGAQVSIDSRDELGELARAFNTMSATLRRTVATLDADRAQLGAILASMVEGVVAVDGEERVVHMNAVAGRLLDVDPKATLGRPIWEVTRLVAVPQALAEAMAEGGAVEREVLRPGLPDRYLELRAAPLQGTGAPGGGAVLLLEDTTRLRRLETVRRDFVGNVSHELKTPLTAIRGLVETLLDRPEPDAATRRRFLEKARLQGERMTTLVADLLSLSRLESQAEGLERRLLDVRGPVKGSLRALQPAADARGVRVVADLPEGPVEVVGDAEALQQAVSNLLDNAIKYSPAGERVDVRVRRLEDRAAIEVADHGPGIEPRHQERIFERFYRVDRARSRELGGTGLGLAIVKHTALAHGGRVTVASRPGEGSTFRVELPIAPVSAPPSARSTGPGS